MDCACATFSSIVPNVSFKYCVLRCASGVTVLFHAELYRKCQYSSCAQVGEGSDKPMFTPDEGART